MDFIQELDALESVEVVGYWYCFRSEWGEKMVLVPTRMESPPSNGYFTEMLEYPECQWWYIGGPCPIEDRVTKYHIQHQGYATFGKGE